MSFAFCGVFFFWETEVLEIRETFVTGRKSYRITSIKANPTVSLSSFTVAWDMWTVNFAGQSKEEDGQKNHKELHDVRIKKRMVRKGRRNGRKRAWSPWSDVLGGSSLPQCWLLLFLVNLILRSLAFTQDQMSDGVFFSCEVCPKVSTPRNLAVVSEVKNTW